MVLRIVIELYSEDYRWYHVNREISQIPIADFTRRLSKKELEEKLKEVGDIGSFLVPQALVIEGVSKIFLSPYCLSVRRSKAVYWEEVEPEILKLLVEALKKFFGETEKIEVRYYRESLITKIKKFFQKRPDFSGVRSP